MRGEILFPVEDSLYFFFHLVYFFTSLLSSLRHTFCGLIEFFHICDRHAPSRQIQTRIFPVTMQEKRKQYCFNLKLLFLFVKVSLRKGLHHVKVRFVTVHNSICEMWQNMEFTSQKMVLITITVVK